MTEPTSEIAWPKGFGAAAGTCGIKESAAPDLALIVSAAPATWAAVFTRNRVVGAPVRVGKRHVRRASGRAFVCNSGCANVATGRRGLDDAAAMCRAVADAGAVDCDERQVLPFSTGVIGQRLPIDRITRGIGELAEALDDGPATVDAVARAILTTDLAPKAAMRTVELGGRAIALTGVAKGSGMIAPNMATMLAFLTTDAAVSAPLLRRALRRAVNADASFNRLSVDSDTSTSDTVAIMASGASGAPALEEDSAELARFEGALTELCRDLAYRIVRDGEGASRVIRVRVAGAATQVEAVRVGRSITDSPLVKTAVHGGDPNWGRIAMAAGKCGAKLDPAKLVIAIGGTTVFRHGEPAPFDEATVGAAMGGAEVVIAVDLGLGGGRCEFLGCDLSREYIAINADYRT